MEFRILGPLEVRDGERSLPLGGRKQRALLALLLLHANEVVSTDRLIDELWGDRPPDTVTTIVHVYVSRLRKALGHEAIVTRPPGYLVGVRPGELDLDTFEELAATGSEALAAGKAAEAAEALRRALAAWRGPALADVAYEPFVQAEVARLEEERLACLEGRIDADLALGRHGELVGELEALVRGHPLRERLRGHLMLALYRSGRQAEALEAYQQTRRALVDELGIDPSPALVRLEKAILQQDQSLEAPPAAATLREAPVEAFAPPPSLSETPPPTEERKVVTVLFADLVGSTELGGTQDPERTRVLLERFYDAMAAEIDTVGGSVEKFVGDAVMAAFGAPAAQEDHAERALHAALSMRRRLGELFGEGLALRIGVETGEVVVGRPREGSSFVTGDAVNVAARLEQAAEPREILVGERTAAAAGGAFEFAEPQTVAAKGKPEEIPCRRLVRALSLARPRGVPGLKRVFVGRESELDLLRATYRRTAGEGEAHAVTIMGEAGVGKTRLVRELWEWLGAEPSNPTRRTGRCLPYGRGITYWALGEVLKEHLGILESDPPETVRARLVSREILGLTLGLESTSDLHPLVARARLHEAWVELVEELTTEAPLVLLVEDLHWAEELLLDLLERLLRDVHGPLLLVGTARPELLDHRPSWGAGRRNAATLWVEPLSLDDARRMLDELFTGELPPDLRELVVESAEGNPFFLEEVLGTLIDSGAIAHEDGRWQLRELPERADIPDSVQAVLAARLDFLPPTEKNALQAASVIGRVFWSDPVRVLLEGAEPDLGLLEERDFIRRRPGSSMAGQREFAIKHALTREVAYLTLPKAKRARLHAAFAAWLEQLGEGRDEHATLLGRHYADAVRPDDVDLAWAGADDQVLRLREKAVTWLRRAADLAVGRYAIDEALELLQRALELEPADAGRAELWQAIGRANALKSAGEAFWTAMQNAIDLTPSARGQAEIYSKLAFETASRPGMWMRSLEGEVEPWIERALAMSEPESAARAYAHLARAFRHPDRGADDVHEAARLAEHLGDLRLRVSAWRASIDVLVEAERYEDSLAAVRENLDWLGELTDPDMREGLHWYAAIGSFGCGLMDEARRQAELMDETDRALTPHHAVHGVAVRLMVEELTGNWEEVTALDEEAERRVAANVATPCVFNVRSLLVCAVASAEAGNDDKARRLEQAADELRMEGYGLTLDAPRVRLALIRGDLETVERLLASPVKTMVLARVPSIAARLDGLAALRDRARLEEEAARLLRPNTYLEPFALRALGIVREEPGLIEQALRRFEALGLEWHAERTRALV